MKKTLLLLASAALLLVGCAKEKFAEPIDGGMTNVTFTASLDGGVATKAAVDGKGTYVNRCIMEIYFQDEFYTRLVQPVTPAAGEAKAYATFSNVPVVAGKQYQVLFWADCGGEEQADKYYTTTNLKTVTVAKEAFLAALTAGENDNLDAFFFADNYTVPQNQAQPFAVTLKRPFAQLNVITTDVGAGKTVFSEDLLPEKVSVSYTADNTINVATGAISKVGESDDYTFTYEADVYGAWSTVTTDHKELTLSMDYILAPATEQGTVDVTFITKNGGQAVMNHSLANLPYKRNYRTNVKGDLLTTAGSWTAKINPIWSSPDFVKVVEVADIKSANQIIKEYAATTDNLEVKFVGVPNDSGIPSGDASSEFRAILTSPLKQDANLGIEVMTNTKTLYVGDYKVEYSITELAEAAQLKAATVNINVPQNSGIGTLIINAPSKTVLVNGHLVESVGTITNIDAITSQNTLIIEKGQQVGTLTMRQGGLEIHGTVGTLVIAEEDHDNNPVKVRACEGLSEDVFKQIYSETEPVCNYIDTRYCAVEKSTTPMTYDIVLNAVAEINGVTYPTLAEAVAAVKNGETITLIKDVVLDKPIETNKTFTLTLNADITPVSGWQTNSYTTDALVIINRGGNITINGTGKISSYGIANAYAAVKLTNKGESETGAAAKLTVDGDVILEGYYYGICGNGSRHNTEITVNGGTIKGMAANDNVGIYHPQKGKLTINGGTIEGASGIYVKSGDVEASINAGTIKGVGTESCKQYDPNRTGDGCDATGDAFVVDNCGYPGGEPTVEILGGTFISENYEAVGSYAKTDYPTVKSFIKGGTFSSDPWKYCAKGYASVKEGEIWKIVNAPKADVIKVHPDPDMTQTIPGSILEALGSNLFYKSETQTPAGIPIPSVENGRMLLAEGYNGVFDLANGLSLNTVGKINGLDVCYIFAAKEDDDTQGEFDNWYADFVVSLDKDVNKDEIGLWGFYASWGVSMAFPAPQTIIAGTEVELLGILGDDGHSTFRYSDIKNTVKVFPCGAFKLSNNIKDATMKVDLRIYDNTDANHEKYFVIESYEYKFTNETNAVISKEVNSQDELNTAISEASAGTEISIVAAGEYKLPDSLGNITISGGVDGVKFDCVGSGSIASIPNGATFENVTLNMGQTEYHGFQHAGCILFKNCTINGYYKTYGDTRFEDCIFNQDIYQYCLNAYGDDLDVVNCTFNNKGKGFYCYNEGNPAHYTVNFTGCTFNVEYGTSAKSQIFVKNNVAGQKYTVNISDCKIGTSNKTIEEYKSLDLDPDLTNGKGDLRLWNVEEGNSKGQYVVVTLEGETVYSYGSLE